MRVGLPAGLNSGERNSDDVLEAMMGALYAPPSHVQAPLGYDPGDGAAAAHPTLATVPNPSFLPSSTFPPLPSHAGPSGIHQLGPRPQPGPISLQLPAHQPAPAPRVRVNNERWSPPWHPDAAHLFTQYPCPRDGKWHVSHPAAQYTDYTYGRDIREHERRVLQAQGMSTDHLPARDPEHEDHLVRALRQWESEDERIRLQVARLHASLKPLPAVAPVLPAAARRDAVPIVRRLVPEQLPGVQTLNPAATPSSPKPSHPAPPSPFPSAQWIQEQMAKLAEDMAYMERRSVQREEKLMSLLATRAGSHQPPTAEQGPPQPVYDQAADPILTESAAKSVSDGKLNLNMTVRIPHFAPHDGILQARSYVRKLLEFWTLNQHVGPRDQLGFLIASFQQNTACFTFFGRHRLQLLKLAFPEHAPYIMAVGEGHTVEDQAALYGKLLRSSVEETHESLAIRRPTQTSLASKVSASLAKTSQGRALPEDDTNTPAKEMRFPLLVAWCILVERVLCQPVAGEIRQVLQLQMGSKSDFHPTVNALETPSQFMIRVCETKALFARHPGQGEVVIPPELDLFINGLPALHRRHFEGSKLTLKSEFETVEDRLAYIAGFVQRVHDNLEAQQVKEGASAKAPPSTTGDAAPKTGPSSTLGQGQGQGRRQGGDHRRSQQYYAAATVTIPDSPAPHLPPLPFHPGTLHVPDSDDDPYKHVDCFECPSAQSLSSSPSTGSYSSAYSPSASDQGGGSS